MSVRFDCFSVRLKLYWHNINDKYMHGLLSYFWWNGFACPRNAWIYWNKEGLGIMKISDLACPCDQRINYVDEWKKVWDKPLKIVTYWKKYRNISLVNDYLRFALKILFTGELLSGAPFVFQILRDDNTYLLWSGKVRLVGYSFDLYTLWVAFQKASLSHLFILVKDLGFRSNSGNQLLWTWIIRRCPFWKQWFMSGRLNLTRVTSSARKGSGCSKLLRYYPLKISPRTSIS